MGSDGLFIKNADKLAIDLTDIDYAVISHGHSDHGGGMKHFLGINQHCKIYLHKNAFEAHYVRTPLKFKYNVGLDPKLKDHKNLVLTEGLTQIGENIQLFSDIDLNCDIPTMNKPLLTKNADGFTCDSFNHEHYILIQEGDKYFLFVGCAHKGVTNIIDYAEKLIGQEMDYVIGGFHLYNPAGGNSEPDPYILSIAQYLKGRKTICLTGHCTGKHAFNLLKNQLGDRIQALSTGLSLELD
jgi:7,8-dihydropterin-6-yl-methyl-4-(beta-D-ribofuranosyl)aminobenzene 5'-phosphate synthase